jgi:hypothetical protein
MGGAHGRDTRATRSIVLVRVRSILVGMALTATACGSEPAEPAGFDEYVVQLEAICASASDQLLALPSAPEQIAVADLATSASLVLDDEATRVDRLTVPTGEDVPLDDLEGDHRAFVRNTREQADAWRAVADTDDLAAATELIAQLVGGRNELARSMLVPGCVRGGL